jgi:hypothetical protein
VRTRLSGSQLARFLIADGALVAMFVGLGVTRGFTTSLIVVFVVAELLVTAALVIALGQTVPAPDSRQDDHDAG